MFYNTKMFQKISCDFVSGRAVVLGSGWVVGASTRLIRCVQGSCAGGVPWGDVDVRLTRRRASYTSSSVNTITQAAVGEGRTTSSLPTFPSLRHHRPLRYCYLECPISILIISTRTPGSQDIRTSRMSNILSYNYRN